MEMRRDSCGIVQRYNVSQKSNKLSTICALTHSGNGFSVPVTIHAWERKLVNFSVNTWFAMFAMQSETKRDFNAQNTNNLQWTQQKQIR